MYFSFNILVYGNEFGYKYYIVHCIHNRVCILCSLIVNKKSHFLGIQMMKEKSGAELFLVSSLFVYWLLLLLSF